MRPWAWIERAILPDGHGPIRAEVTVNHRLVGDVLKHPHADVLVGFVHRRHVQRKALKQQQRAMKTVMRQQELSSDQRGRFNNDLRMQKQMLHKKQKDDFRDLKERPKNAKAASHANLSLVMP